MYAQDPGVSRHSLMCRSFASQSGLPNPLVTLKGEVITLSTKRCEPFVCFDIGFAGDWPIIIFTGRAVDVASISTCDPECDPASLFRG